MTPGQPQARLCGQQKQVYNIEQTDVLIIGGGLSGLVATWQLRAAGISATLLEARDRFGGRILTLGGNQGADCDLGPSWFWPGQPLVAGLLQHFAIADYQQFADGDILMQHPGGHIERSPGPSPMSGARRVQGGLQRLVDMIAGQIDTSQRYLSHVVTGLSSNAESVIVNVEGPSGKLRLQAGQVALAIPPRLVAELAFSPQLPAAAMQALATTPTWMAGHAKFFALYDEPFWRQQGLCGSAFSQRGPLAEIHDASPISAVSSSLFGFAGLDAQGRGRLGRSEFIKQATMQLTALFGEQAINPVAVYLQDWSDERFTASIADREPLTRHPQYGQELRLDGDWTGKLAFISTESSFANGGLIEGALESGLRFARSVIDSDKVNRDGVAPPPVTGMPRDWF